MIWIDGGLHATEVGPEPSSSWSCLADGLHGGIPEDPSRLLDDPDPSWCPMPSRRHGPGFSKLVHEERRPPWSGRMPATGAVPQVRGHEQTRRDIYMSNLVGDPESEPGGLPGGYPQIMYNHHQTGAPGHQSSSSRPSGGRRNHFPWIPLILSPDRAGRNLQCTPRLVQEGKGGFREADPGPDSPPGGTGGLRTTPYYHNIVGLLSESNGTPHPHADPLHSAAPASPATTSTAGGAHRGVAFPPDDGVL